MAASEHNEMPEEGMASNKAHLSDSNRSFTVSSYVGQPILMPVFYGVLDQFSDIQRPSMDCFAWEFHG